MYYTLWKDMGTREWFAEGSFPTIQAARDWATDEQLSAKASEILFIEKHLDDTISIVSPDDEDEED